MRAAPESRGVACIGLADRLVTPRISATSARPARRRGPIGRKRTAEIGRPSLDSLLISTMYIFITTDNLDARAAPPELRQQPSPTWPRRLDATPVLVLAAKLRRLARDPSRRRPHRRRPRAVLDPLGSGVPGPPWSSPQSGDDAGDDRGATRLLRLPRASRVPRGQRWRLRGGIPFGRSMPHAARSARTTSYAPTRTARSSTRTALTTIASSCGCCATPGVRVAEAQALTVADIDLTADREALTVRAGKTPASTRTIPLLPQLVPLLHEHLAHIRRQTHRDA